ncbi:phytanoyl-CoA dioxygenase family protein [Aquimarina sediminis]|uniref:phytanoyl-CoA dioxygenase family protein n=1 Tax=Aquimarina sediminis TaxID=2070536 RepID=UPI000CA04D43|nr:phytanoyl-CoA dioxygenase family protein [Aquimarina sediminis]
MITQQQQQQQIDQYHDQGFLLIEDIFTKEEIHLMNKELPSILEDDSPRKVKESNGEIRSYYGAHQVNDIYKRLSSKKKLIDPVMQILESKVYIHQTKINFKKALRGEWWEWHQDYPYWKIEDGMTSPRVISVMIYLDDVTEFNGPLMVIPGSHKSGIASFDDKQKFTSNVEKATWTGANLKYTIDRSILKKGFEEDNVISVPGKAGSALFFHGNIFHASNCNISPFDRKTYIVTYNSVNNVLDRVEKERPEYLSERDVTPIIPLDDTTFYTQLENSI